MHFQVPVWPIRKAAPRFMKELGETAPVFDQMTDRNDARSSSLSGAGTPLSHSQRAVILLT